MAARRRENNPEQGPVLDLEWYGRTAQSLARGLARILADREPEFLALGQRLMDFTTVSGRLSSEAQALAALAAGEDIGQGARELAASLQEMNQVCDVSGSQESHAALQQLMLQVEDLTARMGSFARIVRSLQMLGISTRIESARLGDQGLGFGTLADDVEKLAGQIVSNTAAIQEKAKSLGVLVADAGAQTLSLVESQTACSSRIVADMQDNLSGLSGLLESSRTLSGALSARSREVAAGVSEVVSALQFHDIVRQQVEHVEEALQDMQKVLRERGQGGAHVATGPQDAAGAGTESDARDLIGWIADLARLQESQLDNASQRFREALDTLRDNLAHIGQAATVMRQDAESLAAAGQGGQGNVLDRIAASTGSIIAAMREFAGRAEHIGQLMSSVAATVSAMSAFVEDIEEVGAAIELIALNASVKAARTGDQGRALGVLAQAIQKLSGEARERTAEVSRSLGEIAQASGRLERSAAAALDTTRLDQMAGREEGLMGRLREVNQALLLRLEAIRELGRTLSGEVESAIRAATLDREICPSLDRAREEMHGLGAAARKAAPLSTDTGRPQRLKELLSRYTMEAERLVHEAAFGLGAGPAAAPAGGQAELFDADDNVELF